MPKPTKIQEYSDVLFIAENLLAASVALKEDVHDLDSFEGDKAEIHCNDISEILDLKSLNWLKIAESMRKVAAGMSNIDQLVKTHFLCNQLEMSEDKSLQLVTRWLQTLLCYGCCWQFHASTGCADSVWGPLKMTFDSVQLHIHAEAGLIKGCVCRLPQQLGNVHRVPSPDTAMNSDGPSPTWLEEIEVCKKFWAQVRIPNSKAELYPLAKGMSKTGISWGTQYYNCEEQAFSYSVCLRETNTVRQREFRCL
ncbi:hypothetical protein DFH07DRAFT_777888 [Mycena maculata]|uniref:Uncharacterized protein n=1 Tax=Mycena maculata TaxID=230809 RepID=A0AAD7IGL9_9AGAR|nr:hypothetical protein DFH07DRAFT_777888 [Mycena maculata]